MKLKEDLIIILETVAESLPKECSICLRQCSLSKDGKYLLRCKRKSCRTKFNVFRNTFLAKIEIREKWKVLRILDLWINNLNLESIIFVTGFGNDLIKKTLNLIRDIRVPKYYETIGQLGGEGVICEIDESKFGKRKYNKGRLVKGVWVLGIVERSERRKVFLIPVKERTMVTLSSIINKMVIQTSIIYTDKWKGYSRLHHDFALHESVDHSKYFMDPNTGVHTQSIEGNWAAIKYSIPKEVALKTISNVICFVLCLGEMSQGFYF